MRISDWSSYVCSSDLSREDPGGATGSAGWPAPLPVAATFRQFSAYSRTGCAAAYPVRHRPARRHTGDGTRAFENDHRRFGADRQSVVEGKSVSVRVDLGGRRNINKKTKK